MSKHLNNSINSPNPKNEENGIVNSILVFAKKSNLYLLNVGLILIVWINLNSVEYWAAYFLSSFTRFYSVDWNNQIIPVTLLFFILLSLIIISKFKFKNKQRIIDLSNKVHSQLWILAFYVYYIFCGRSGFIVDGVFYLPADIQIFDSKVIILDYFLFLHLLIWIKPCQIKYEKNNKSIFKNDTPKPIDEIDLFHRQKILEKLAQEIDLFYDDNYSFVIGIEGKWGSGKTTFINELENKFQFNEDYTIVRLNPWQYQSSQEILKGFFSHLSNKLLKTNGLKSKHLEGYIQSIINGNKIFSFFSKFGNSENSDFHKSALNDDIIQSQIKIMVIIDDLDRLDKDELKIVLNIVRNIGNLANTIFVIAYDKTQVLKILNNDESFSKFIQVEISLGIIEKASILNYLEEEFKKMFPKEIEVYNSSNKLIVDASENSLSDLSNFKNTPSLSLLRNKRDAIRLLNNFSLQYSLLKDTVNFNDFLILTIINLKHPEIYQKIKHKEAFKFDYFSRYYELRDDKELGIIEDEELRITLLALFPRNQDARIINSISSKEYFDVYFKNEPYNELNFTELKDVFDV